jgi:hypothetical protein
VCHDTKTTKKQEEIMFSAFSKRIISLLTICAFVCCSTTLLAQSEQEKKKEKEEKVKIVPVKYEKLPKVKLKEKFKKLKKYDKEIISLSKHLDKKGFRPAEEDANYRGIQEVYEDEEGDQITVEFIVQDYKKAKSKDGAAIGQITVQRHNRSKVYSFSLVTPEGKVKESVEYMVDKEMNVIEAHSWWSCVEGQLLRSTVDCIAALGTCAITALLAVPGNH